MALHACALEFVNMAVSLPVYRNMTFEPSLSSPRFVAPCLAKNSSCSFFGCKHCNQDDVCVSVEIVGNSGSVRSENDKSLVRIIFA